MNQNQHTEVTQRHVPPVAQTDSSKWRLNWWVVLLSVFLTPVLLCGAGLVVYLIIPPAQTDILVLGVDSRDGEGWVTRADTVMIVGINPSRLHVSLLSIPRDLFVDVPGYGLQRVNTVNMLGEMESSGRGPELVAAAIEQGFGIGVERYVRLDFNGFVDLIDAVGGITIDVERAIVDTNYPTDDYGIMTIQFDPGVQHMDGERALIYARTRYADDDYRRVGRQQQIVSALLGRLVNPAYWPSALGVLHRSVDTNLTLWDMMRLAPPVLVNRGRFDQLVIDREYITATSGGAAVPDYEKIRPWLEGRFD
jgi:LCP family protein required for cell wall assembly